MKKLFLLCLSLISLQPLLAQKKKEKKPDGVEMLKGVKFAALTMSLDGRQAENENQLIQYAIKEKRNNWNLRVDAGYMIKENFALGLGYEILLTNSNGSFLKSDGTEIETRSHGIEHTFNPFAKPFIPLGVNHRFYVITQAELDISFGQSVKETISQDILIRTYTSTHNYGIGFRPGLMIFIVRNFAFETTVGVLGLNRSVERTSTTDEPETKIVKSNLDFRINLLQLSFTFSVYF